MAAMARTNIPRFKCSVIVYIIICSSFILNDGHCSDFPKKIESLLAVVQKVGGACAPPVKPCDKDSIFYTYDGSCNNLQNPAAGQAKTPYARILPALYGDGFFQDRLDGDNKPLPLARLVRTTLMPVDSIPTNYVNILFEGFGQFVSHDTTRSPVDTANPQVACCVNNAPVIPIPDQCRPLIIPPDDPFYSKLGITCLPNRRLVSTKTLGCEAKPVLMINNETAFLDLSIVYSADEGIANELRAPEGGLLKVKNDSDTNNQEFPIITSGAENCPLGGITPQAGGKCFFAGDSRINQNIEILVFDVLIVKLHNYLAKSLKDINKSWDSDNLYFHARRIATAMYQHVISKEYIPLLIGPDVAKFYGLLPAEDGFIEGYNANLNPQTFHSFASAASRASHSTIAGVISYTKGDGQPGQYKLREKLFNNEFIFAKDEFINVVKALAVQSCNTQDQFFSEEVTEHLFEVAGAGFGSDLVATDINREREFGMQGYNAFRVLCGLKKLTKVEDFKDEISKPEYLEKIATLYPRVDDMDLYVGLVLEKPLPGSTLGPTAACIVGAQFHHYKYPDRFWYEFESAKFSKEQLKSIRTISLSSLICMAMPEIKEVRKNSLLVESPENPVIPCDQVPKIDLQLWAEKN